VLYFLVDNYPRLKQAEG
jgi:hypothetical protein